MRRFLVPVVAVAALVAGACGGGGEDAGQIVRAAASKTTAAESSRMALVFDATSGDQHITVTGSGAFEYGTRRGSLTMDLSGFPMGAGLGTLEAVTDGSLYYVKFPAELAGQFLGGKQWVRFDFDALASQTSGIDLGQLSQLGQSDPTQALQYLRGASDDVSEVGKETVRGTETTHYRATLDLAKAGEQLSGQVKAAYDKAVSSLGSTKLPADVWVDAEGRARKVRLAPRQVESADGSPGSMTITMELFDFGVDVDAEPPPADQVVDLGELLGGGRAG